MDRTTPTRRTAAARGHTSLAVIADAFFQPAAHIVERPARRQARMLMVITLADVLIFAISTVVALVAPNATGGAAAVPILVVATVMMTVAQVLSRTRHVRLAAYLAIVVGLAGPVGFAFLLRHDPNVSLFASGAWILTGLITASALGTPRTTAIGAGAGIGALAVTVAIAQNGWAHELAPTLLFLAGNAFLVIVFSVHRNHLERDRAEELRARNEELEALKTTLEHRVAERTTELRRNQERLLITEKMASLGRLTAGMAHEMNSPLAAVLNSLKGARECAIEYRDSIGHSDVNDDDHLEIAAELESNLSLAVGATERVTAFVRSIRTQTRGAADRHRVRFDAVTTVRDALHLLGYAVADNRSRVRFSPATTTAELEGDPGRIAQVVTNLVTNAIDANAERGGGDVDVELETRGTEIVLQVRDEGPGIAPEHRARIFDPLFTTKPIGKGTGLGLSIVHDIVHGDFGGRIEVMSAPGAGATFTIHLPCAEGA